MKSLPLHLRVGVWGEEQAERHLRKQGWRVLARNWRGGGGELDRILIRRGILVFLEVRVRKKTAQMSPFFTISPRKKLLLKRASRAYLRTLKKRPLAIRMDVIGIQYTDFDDFDLQHFENVGWLGPWTQ